MAALAVTWIRDTRRTSRVARPGLPADTRCGPPNPRRQGRDLWPGRYDRRRLHSRMVGYCLAAPGNGSDVPWQRVINCMGKVSPRKSGLGSQLQRELLIEEGVKFDNQGRVSFEEFGWNGTVVAMSPSDA